MILLKARQTGLLPKVCDAGPSSPLGSGAEFTVGPTSLVRCGAEFVVGPTSPGTERSTPGLLP